MAIPQGRDPAGKVMVCSTRGFAVLAQSELLRVGTGEQFASHLARGNVHHTDVVGGLVRLGVIIVVVIIAGLLLLEHRVAAAQVISQAVGGAMCN
jgi:hypothetical protein